MNLKRNLWLLSLAGICFSFCTQAQDTDIRRDAVVNAVEQVMPSVVNIATKSVVPVQDPFEAQMRRFWGQRMFDEYYSLGSGVVIDENGYLLTNNHVVKRAQQIAVRFGTGTNEYTATVVASDAKADVALLKLKGRPGEKFHAIKLAREDDLLLGETVLALGDPLGLGGTVTRGILSSKSRTTPREGEELTYENWLQTDAAINPGNSGGPLVNLRGELIGINVAVLNETQNGEPVQGIGFAIPIREVEEALSDIFPTEFVKSYWFGARVKVGSYPLVVTSVQPESPAGRAGIKVGDTVLQVNGTVPKTFVNFNDLLASNATAEIPITIRRGEVSSDVQVHLVPVKSVFNAKMVRDKLGLSLKKTSDGFVITDVESGSPASQAGLQPQMIIRAIDQQAPPDDITGLARLLYAKKKNETVRLDIAVVEQVGNFNVLRRGVVELTPR
ncbi:MAG TPA: trypsin-like peptidase domain-containing protein [Candidatus Polarisedimenticolia bacterium]|nr:trypsin-like peptidase domain-containing protein [Candidatus Polarisedimenticolia bacterium]